MISKYNKRSFKISTFLTITTNELNSIQQASYIRFETKKNNNLKLG